MSSRHRHAVIRFHAGASQDNPLRRTSDRIEAAAARVLVALALLVALPIGGLVGARHYDQGTHAAATSHQTTAVVLATDQSGQQPGSASTVFHKTRTTVSWQPTAGTRRVDVVELAVPQPVGATVPLWLDRAGNPVSAPKSAGALVVSAVLLGLLTALGVSSVSLVAFGLLCRVLDLRRSRAWQAEWAEVEPLWSRQIH